MDDVITLETNNLLNNDGKQMKEVGSFQENYDKYHIELNNVEIGSGQKGLEKDEVLDAHDKGVSRARDSDMEVVPKTLDLSNHSILVIMDNICDPNKVNKNFQLLDFDGWNFTYVTGYAGGFVIAWREGDVSTSFPNVYVKVLARANFSDHHPILITLFAELHGSKMELTQEAKKIRCTPPSSSWMRLNTNEDSKNDLIVECGSVLRGVRVSDLEASHAI
ncbi:hypothetical protein KIW84_060496 [Lathyrus oleraceus]|uniref:Uncharacterized protein n=1 Tax=Pisum sativum TaxID=3888 RepID=A0A9D4VZV0_PEA|nr:hypothetical protein KIW84_060496 [Pisum sativum]